MCVCTRVCVHVYVYTCVEYTHVCVPHTPRLYFVFTFGLEISHTHLPTGSNVHKCQNVLCRLILYREKIHLQIFANIEESECARSCKESGLNNVMINMITIQEYDQMPMIMIRSMSPVSW